MRRVTWMVSLATAACSSGGSSGGPSPLMDAAPTLAMSSDASAADASNGMGEAAALEDFDAGAPDFDCFTNSEWTGVGLSHYKNELGHTAEMLSVAHSADGGTFPVGTIVQLNPAEAMVKRGAGFNASSNDWEFFTLVNDAGATVTARGGGTTVSNANGPCLGCHLPAQAAWDLVCGDDPDAAATTAHGCKPLPVPYSVLAAIVNPRCL